MTPDEWAVLPERMYEVWSGLGLGEDEYVRVLSRFEVDMILEGVEPFDVFGAFDPWCRAWPGRPS